MRLLFAFAFVLAASPLAAQETTVTHEEGLAAWDRIFAVTSHPRCTNCHVGDQGVPMWEGLAGVAGAKHGMNVQADESRIGAESVPCRTCHVTSAAQNTVPHAPPHIDEAWRLPPIELEWLGKTSAEVCAQMRNPETNDGNTIAELADHIQTSAFVNWGFQPGADRSTPPGTAQDMARDVAVWGAAGTPCADS